MSADRGAIASTPPTARSAVANGSRLFVEGLDGRSALARRYRDLVAEFATDLGGQDHLTLAQQSIVKRASALIVWCESVEVKLANGDEVEIGPYTTAINSLRRLLQDIGLDRKARDITPTLDKYLADTYGGAAA